MTAPFDAVVAHRWFAVEANNTAWDVYEQSSRTREDVERMLDAAHAARLHWSHAGGPVNALRAEHLLALAHALAGDGAAALRHAQRALEALEHAQGAFDRAMTWLCAARASEAAGDGAQAAEHLQRAKQESTSLDDDERPVFEKLAAS